jgi:magnesium transporter
MAITTITSNNVSWSNIDELDAEAKAFLTKDHSFHPLDLEDVEARQQTPKMDVYKNYVFLVLQLPYWDPATRAITTQEIDIFAGKSYVITIQNSPPKELREFLSHCMNSPAIRDEWMNHGSGFLLYQILEALFHNTRPILNNLGKHIAALEEQIFSGNQQSGAILDLGIYRRDVLSFRRILDPERQIILSLSNVMPPFLVLDEPLQNYFDDINDYLNNMWAVVNSYKDTIDGLHVTVESLINRRINKIISSLTIISVSLLPLNLLSGIYGMNLESLPFADEPRRVWAMFAGLSAIIIAAILFMKRKKWL